LMYHKRTIADILKDCYRHGIRGGSWVVFT
jgi:hypothetical protein